jgi:hypothetical protein
MGLCFCLPGILDHNRQLFALIMRRGDRAKGVEKNLFGALMHRSL